MPYFRAHKTRKPLGLIPLLPWGPAFVKFYWNKFYALEYTLCKKLDYALALSGIYLDEMILQSFEFMSSQRLEYGRKTY